MNLQDLFGSRRNRKPGKSFVSKRAQRKLFLESLESRQMMAIAAVHTEHDVLPFADFAGNYRPPTHSKSATEGFLSGPASGDALTVGINYFKQNAATFGLGAADLQAGRYRVTGRHTTESGITHIYLQQMFNGLPIADANASISLMADGSVVAASANFVPGLSYPTSSIPLAPQISALDAVGVLATGADLSVDVESVVATPPSGFNQKTILRNRDVSLDDIPAELQYVPSLGGNMDLAWHVVARTPDGNHWVETNIAASGSRVGSVIRMGDWVSHASYNVLPLPLKDALEGSRQIVVNPADPVASPLGWHDTDGVPGPEFFDTRGNNVFAQDDLNGDDLAGTRPTGSATNDFSSPADLTLDPLTYLDAAITNLFYVVNVAHDVTFHYGFDEAAGNFQFRNYSGLPFSGDPVIADAQDGASLNNAFMLTPPDGFSPRMDIGLTIATLPFRDADFDNVTILHEFFHGVTNRLTGGPQNALALNSLQGGGMGEGWSDWFGLLMTLKPTDNRNTPLTIGGWTDGVPNGFRRGPYSFNMTTNPRNLGDFSVLLDPQSGFPGSEPHNAGEIWASALMDMTWLLIEKYGFSTDMYNGNGGNNVALQLVIDALKLQPVNPSFTEARNAIISADFALTGGANYSLIWSAFARRGLGLNASSGVDSNSPLVNANFDVPAGPALVTGTVFSDGNGNAQRDSNEAGLGGWVIYADANNNGQLDSGERRTTSASDGTYSLFVFSSGSTWIREVPKSGFTQTLPANNAGRRINLVRGQAISGQNFGNRAVPAQINGLVWNDNNGDGLRDTGEAGVPNIVVFVDLNNDGRLNLLEYSALTDKDGHYAIKGVPPGSYTVRVLKQPGMPVDPPTHFRIVTAGQVMTGVNFPLGQRELDFGDAPDSYGTTRANNGARHGVLTSSTGGVLRLGGLIDDEADGQPNTTATGDDTNPLPPDPLPDPAPQSPDDEDGVVFLGGLTPGFPTTVQVTVNTGGNFAGKLQGWIDFNRDGDFADAGEKIISNRSLATGVHNVTFTVPTTAAFGATYARFRYGYETDLGPTGSSVAGEVEDYAVNLLANVPIAAPDTFAIKQGSTDNVLDVLANDTTTTFGAPSIVPGSFPATLPSGSTLRLNAAGDRILFTPGPFSLGDETFTYQVTDGNTVSAPGLVTVNIGIRDPLALDDSVTIPFATTPGVTQINVLANDIFPFANTTIVDVRKVTTDPDTGPASMTIAAGGAALNFQPPSGFKGTIIYEYTISDADPTTNDSTGLLTIQIVDVIAGVPTPDPNDYTAAISMQILDPISQLPISAVNVGQEFLVRVVSDDLRLGGSAANRGVEAAYLDMLFNRELVEPVLDPNNPAGFAITYSDDYPDARTGVANSPAPGQIDDVGAANLSFSGNGLGTGLVTVFTVRMRAKAPTPAGQPTQIVGSSAEPPNDVIVMPDDPTNDPTPILLPDERVFFAASNPLTITGIGEAEFSNYFNPLDVNGDFSVSPIDAVLVINELNSGGSQALSPLAYATKGLSRPANLLDVSMDSFLAPIDAVLVINYLNAQARPVPAASMGEGEGASAASLLAGEGEGEADSGLAAASAGADDSLLAALLLSSSEEATPATTTGGETSETPENQVFQTTATAGISPVVNEKPQSLFRSRFVSVNTDAADEVFATFAGSQQAVPTSRFSFGDRLSTKSRMLR